MEVTTQREVDLRSSSGENLKQAGYNVTPQSLNPNDQTALQNIKDMLGDAVHVVGSEIGEKLAGQGADTYTRVSPGNRFSHWVLDRFRRKQK